MNMAYWFGTELKNFLFYGYNILTVSGLLSTCFGLSALAILYEAMKLLQIRLREYSRDRYQVLNSAQNTDSSSLLSKISERSPKHLGFTQCNSWVKWLVEVLHWSAHVTLGYFLMLAVMTFNGYISIALVIGSGVGYYIFGPILHEINIKKLHKRKKSIQCNPQCSDAIVSTERRNSAVSIVSNNLETEVNVDVDVHIISEE